MLCESLPLQHGWALNQIEVPKKIKIPLFLHLTYKRNPHYISLLFAMVMASMERRYQAL